MTRSRWTLAVLLLLVVLAAGLRLYRLDAQSLWYDEGASLRYAERTPGDIWRNTAADIHPPGYYVLLSGWAGLLGTSEAALRGLSVVFGVLLVAQVFVLGRRLFNPATGLLAAALVAVDPFHVYYGQEARMYTLLASLAAASLWLFLRWLDEADASRRWLWLAGLVAANAAAMYTHYVYPFFIAAESLLFLAWWLWEDEHPRDWRELGLWAGAQAATFVLFLPWLPIALRHVGGFPRAQVTLSLGQGLLDMASLLSYGQTLPSHSGAGGLVPLGILAVVGLFPPLEGDTERPTFAWRAGLLLAWLLVPVAAMFAFKLYVGGYLRFVLPADFALSLFVARGVWLGLTMARTGAPGIGRGGWVAIVVVALAAFGLAPTLQSLRNLYFEPAYARDDYRAIARHLSDVAGPDEAIILNGPNQWEVFTYYYPPGDEIHPLPNSHTEAELDAILSASRRVYAVFYGENERDPHAVVESTLDTRAFEAETRWYGNVRLVTYGVSSLAREEPAVHVDARFGDAVRLLGYTLDAGDAHPGGLLDVALYWQADTALDESYSVFVHLVGDEGAPPLAQHDGLPGGGRVLTHTWTPGQTVRDGHGILLPLDLAPGDYTLVVGMVRPESGERLPVTLDGAPGGDHLSLTSLKVE